MFVLRLTNKRAVVNDSKSLFEAKSISKRYGRIPALRNIDLTLNAGDFVTIFGANGAGKTTFLKIAASLMGPSDGAISIDGVNVRDLGIDARKKIGYIAHDLFLYDHLTARENLRFFAKMYSIDDPEAKIENKLEAVGLLKRADDTVRSFSRGMKQRLTIARAFQHDPALLLLDEPYTGLDSSASEILNSLLGSSLLGSFHTNDRACLMVTHDIDHGFDIATHVAILHDTKIRLFKETKDIDKTEFKKQYLEMVRQA